MTLPLAMTNTELYGQAAQTLLFYLSGALAVLLAIAVVTTRRILRAAVYLMAVLVVSAVFFVLLSAPFMAAIQIMLYVGGIVVLLTFAIMLTSQVGESEDQPGKGRLAWGLASAVSFFVLAVTALATSHLGKVLPPGDGEHNAQRIGKALLDYGEQGYILPFEVISLLLLAVIIAGIVIARRQPETPVTKEPGA
jgi:NADH-quinone oxidoreductase subunit J